MKVETPQKYATPNLLPCPFCGGQAEVKTHGGWEEFSPTTEYPFGVFFSVQCSQPMSGPKLKCQIQPCTFGMLTPQLAADVWNSRAQDVQS